MNTRHPRDLPPLEFDLCKEDLPPPVSGSQTLSVRVSEDVGTALEFTPVPKSEKKFTMIHEGSISTMILEDREDVTPETAEELRRFPHVLKKIQPVWGNPALFHRLMEEFVVMEGRRQSVRRGDGVFWRQGFPPDVLSEMLAMMETHDRMFGLPPNVEKTIEFRSRQGFPASVKKKTESGT